MFSGSGLILRSPCMIQLCNHGSIPVGADLLALDAAHDRKNLVLAFAQALHLLCLGQHARSAQNVKIRRLNLVLRLVILLVESPQALQVQVPNRLLVVVLLC